MRQTASWWRKGAPGSGCDKCPAEFAQLNQPPPLGRTLPRRNKVPTFNARQSRSAAGSFSRQKNFVYFFVCEVDSSVTYICSEVNMFQTRRTWLRKKIPGCHSPQHVSNEMKGRFPLFFLSPFAVSYSSFHSLDSNSFLVEIGQRRKE